MVCGFNYLNNLQNSSLGSNVLMEYSTKGKRLPIATIGNWSLLHANQFLQSIYSATLKPIGLGFSRLFFYWGFQFFSKFNIEIVNIFITQIESYRFEIPSMIHGYPIAFNQIFPGTNF